MELGVAIGGDLRTLGRLAREVENTGFESLWVAETARSAFIQAAIASAETSQIRVGTGVALAFPRSPVVAAMTARDLAEFSSGRFTLGLGTQVKRVNEDRFSVPFEHPAPKIAEFISVVREVWDAYGGAPIEHRGRFYSVTMPPLPGAGPPPSPIPIYLAAVNVRMAETAGALADGVLGHPLTSPAYLGDVFRPAVERGAQQAGRPPGAVNITTSLVLHVSKDRKTARREAAHQLGIYATTRTYTPVLAYHGFDDLVEPIREAFGRGDFAELTELAMPMTEVFSIVGEPDECRERVAAFDGLVDRVILEGVWVGAQDRVADNHRAIVEAFTSH